MGIQPGDGNRQSARDPHNLPLMVDRETHRQQASVSKKRDTLLRKTLANKRNRIYKKVKSNPTDIKSGEKRLSQKHKDLQPQIEPSHAHLE
jgi:hypothetical protein